MNKKRKPRSFSLSDDGFAALLFCEKHYPHLEGRRGRIVSLALENMARNIEASRRSRFRAPDEAEWAKIQKTLDEIGSFLRDASATLDAIPPSGDSKIEQEIKARIQFSTEELDRIRARVARLAPIAGYLTTKDNDDLIRFLEIAKQTRQTNPDKEHQRKEILAAFALAVRLLEPLV